jgi:hypothetical protein
MEYLKLYLGLLITSPLYYMFIALDHGINTQKTNLIVLFTYLFLFIIGTIMFNYLEYGVIYKPKTIKTNQK